MKISEELPQFSESRALIVVSGKQSGELYLAHNGNIDLVKKISVKKPAYSDREGFFVKSGRGERFGSGSVFENSLERKVRKEFLKELENSLGDIEKKFQIGEVYIFAPGYVIPQVGKVFLEKKIGITKKEKFRGNYINVHPFELLKKIKNKKERKTFPVLKDAARKILERAKRARRIIGRK